MCIEYSGSDSVAGAGDINSYSLNFSTSYPGDMEMTGRSIVTGRRLHLLPEPTTRTNS
jgi:hypothetical protein